MDFLIVADVFSKYILVRKLPNSTSAAVCIELSMIVTELGLPYIIISDNSPCYNSKEFQQFLQCYSITHQTSSPNHPRSNGFVERMVGVAKKLMHKAGKEGKPWISGLFDYRVTLQSGSIASPLQLMTQCTPREKSLPQLPSALGAPEMCTKFILYHAGKWCRTTSSVPFSCMIQYEFGAHWFTTIAGSHVAFCLCCTQTGVPGSNSWYFFSGLLFPCLLMSSWQIPKSSNSSCNVTASHTRQAAQITQDLMDLLREWWIASWKC